MFHWNPKGVKSGVKPMENDINEHALCSLLKTEKITAVQKVVDISKDNNELRCALGLLHSIKEKVMKAKRKVRKSVPKKAPSRRKKSNIANKARATNHTSKGSLKKKKLTKRRTKMSVNKPLATVSTNEESTVKLVKKLLGDESIDAIAGSDDEVNLLQDLDLLVLGSPPEEYKRYRELLRKEYSHLDENSYKQMRLKLDDAQPSTSRQATTLEHVNGISSPSPSAKRPNQLKKPFVKFKDNKHRASQIRKIKADLKNKTSHRLVHLPTKTLPSPSQIVSRKILRCAKKKSVLSRPNRNSSRIERVSPTLRISSTERAVNLEKIKPNSPAKQISVKPQIIAAQNADNVDDDCVCIDPQPEVILIDDDTVTLSRSAKDNKMSGSDFKAYEPIGNMRWQLQSDSITRMYTSTPKTTQPKYRLEFGGTFYGDTDNCMLPDYLAELKEQAKEKERNNAVVVIDDTTTPSRSSERASKRKRSDDSVIFVSEEAPKSTQRPGTPALTFIPLDTPEKECHVKLIPTQRPFPKKAKGLGKSLFNSKEKKQIAHYNDNAYNPNKEDDQTPLTKKRMVIVDGSNVAYHHALNKEFSVKGLKICLDYFEKMGHEVKAVVPQYRLQKQKSTNPSELEKLHSEGKIIFTPCKNLPGKSSSCYDDRFVLQLAAELDAAVVSNDNYRDLIHENPAFKKIIENRVVGYTWCNDLFILPKDPYGKWGPALSTILNRT